MKFNAEISKQGRLIIYLLATFVASNFLIRERQRAATESIEARVSQQGHYHSIVSAPKR